MIFEIFNKPGFLLIRRLELVPGVKRDDKYFIPSIFERFDFPVRFFCFDRFFRVGPVMMNSMVLYDKIVSNFRIYFIIKQTLVDLDIIIH